MRCRSYIPVVGRANFRCRFSEDPGGGLIVDIFGDSIYELNGGQLSSVEGSAVIINIIWAGFHEFVMNTEEELQVDDVILLNGAL